jgi:hypothetical protein
MDDPAGVIELHGIIFSRLATAATGTWVAPKEVSRTSGQSRQRHVRLLSTSCTYILKTLHNSALEPRC